MRCIFFAVFQNVSLYRVFHFGAPSAAKKSQATNLLANADVNAKLSTNRQSGT
jgi:hypothetical protein